MIELAFYKNSANPRDRRSQLLEALAVCMQTIQGTMFFIQARDAAGQITIRRDTREAAEKKVEELRQMGCFEVEIIEEAPSKVA